MERFYTIYDNYAEIVLVKEIYPMVSVKKALANFLDYAYISIDTDGNNLIIKIQLKENKYNMNELIGELYNELLRESLRYEISNETKNLRELIVGRALYTTCIQLDEEQRNDEDLINEKVYQNYAVKEYDLEDIAQNWFDKYGKEEDEKC